jgi:hypothetical protein
MYEPLADAPEAMTTKASATNAIAAPAVIFANSGPLPQGTTSRKAPFASAAAAQSTAAIRPCFQIALPNISQPSRPARCRPRVVAADCIGHDCASRQQIDSDALGELLRICRWIEHLDQLEVFRGDPDLIDQRLTDWMVVVDELSEN